MTPRPALLAALLAALPAGARAAPADDLARSLAALGVPEDEAAAAAADDLAAVEPGRAGAFAALALSAAELARDAAHPATRAALRDLHRQLVWNAVADPAASPTLGLLDAADPHLLPVADAPGVGVARSDVRAAAALDALAAGALADPAADPGPARVAEAEARVEAGLAAAPRFNQQLVSRLDAWRAGLAAAWPDLSPEARAGAAGIAFSPEPVPPEVVEAVTGSPDLLAWLGGLDLALTDAERAAHPDLVAYLAEGHLTGGATEELAARLGTGLGAQALGTAGLTTGVELNGQLLWGDLAGPSVAGDLVGIE